MPHGHLSVFLPLQSCPLGRSQQAGGPILVPLAPRSEPARNRPFGVC